MSAYSFAHTGVSKGVVVGDIYWAVPRHYTQGDRHESRTEALRAAIKLREELMSTSPFVPETVTVDERWVFKNAEGVPQLDTVIHRESIPTIAEARHLLSLAEKYGGIRA